MMNEQEEYPYSYDEHEIQVGQMMEIDSRDEGSSMSMIISSEGHRRGQVMEVNFGSSLIMSPEGNIITTMVLEDHGGHHHHDGNERDSSVEHQQEVNIVDGPFLQNVVGLGYTEEGEDTSAFLEQEIVPFFGEEMTLMSPAMAMNLDIPSSRYHVNSDEYGHVGNTMGSMSMSPLMAIPVSSCQSSDGGDGKPNVNRTDTDDLFHLHKNSSTTDDDDSGDGENLYEGTTGSDTEILSSMSELESGQDQQISFKSINKARPSTATSQDAASASAKGIKKPHHKGPLPDTFIQSRSDRRNRFSFGLQTVIAKIKYMKRRTGAVTDFKVLFEDQEYTMENAVELLNFKARSSRAYSALDQTEDDVATSEEPTDDHRYAATQRLSSPTVHDHQYNETYVSAGMGKRRRFREGTVANQYLSYVKRNYERDRTLQKILETLFTKVTRLENRTGAQVSMTVKYEEFEFTASNYKDVSSILRKRKKSRIANGASAPSTITSESQSGDTITAENSDKCDSIKLKPSTSTRGAKTKPNPDNPPSSSKFCLDKVKREVKVPFNFSSTGDVPTDGSSVDSSNTRQLLMTPPYSGSDSERVQELEYKSTPHAHVNRRSVSTMTDTANNTEPICCKCTNSIPPNGDPTQSGFDQQWIRCFSPLCPYLVHPVCIGFFVSSATELKYFPPYYCETHRKNI